jgi:uncharacterized protein (DUF2236 family)
MYSHYEAFARGDSEDALQMMDEQIEFSVAEHSVFHRGQAVRDGRKSRKVASAVWGLNGMVSILKRQA